MWLTVINEIFKFSPHSYPFDQVSYLYELSPGYPKSKFENDTFGLVSRLLERDFVNYRNPYG